MEYGIWNKTKLKILRFLAPIILVAVLFSGAALVFWPKSTGNSAEFVIESGQSLGATARELAERDFVASRLLFVFYSILTGHEKDFKAGRYLLPERASIRDLVKIFSEGRVESDDIEVTIPEGTNVADIDKIFAKAGLTKEGDILGHNFKHGSTFVQEGFLFPDTYRFDGSQIGKSEIRQRFRSDSQASRRNLRRANPKPEKIPNVENTETITQEIIEKIRSNFYIKTREVFAGRFIGQGGADRGYETIIIASILEKEVKTETDMRLVAGIIKKRLELGMPLQVDAAVAYGVCYPRFLEGKYCDVSLANIVDNLKIDSEYNTYARKGLPIGPISNPGLKAIRAALNPRDSEYLYYLSAKDGTTIFSKTAAEHERARAKYLRN